MNRIEELEKVKKVIKKNYKDANCGIFNTRNTVGDGMDSLFKGKYFTIDICYYWAYFEIFGTTNEEFKELEQYYSDLGGMTHEKVMQTLKEFKEEIE